MGRSKYVGYREGVPAQVPQDQGHRGIPVEVAETNLPWQCRNSLTVVG